MRVKTPHFFLWLFLAFTAPIVMAQTSQVQQHNLERYQSYLGEPIDEFRFWNLYQWELLGADKVALWSTIRDAYLITVELPCNGLEWAHSIGVSSALHTVKRKFDAIEFHDQRCPIKEIRRIDYRRMQADEVKS